MSEAEPLCGHERSVADIAMLLLQSAEKIKTLVVVFRLDDGVETIWNDPSDDVEILGMLEIGSKTVLDMAFGDGEDGALDDEPEEPDHG